MPSGQLATHRARIQTQATESATFLARRIKPETVLATAKASKYKLTPPRPAPPRGRGGRGADDSDASDLDVARAASRLAE